MYKSVGLRRSSHRSVHRSTKAAAQKTPAVNKSGNQSLGDLFSDIDFSDICVDLNASHKNSTFKSTRSVLNEDITEDNNNNNDTNWPPIADCLDSTNNALDDSCLDTTAASKSLAFKSLSKLSIVSTNSRVNKSYLNESHPKRKEWMKVFADEDLTDLGIGSDMSSVSFQSTRKVIKTRNVLNEGIVEDNNNNNDINWPPIGDCLDEPNNALEEEVPQEVAPEMEVQNGDNEDIFEDNNQINEINWQSMEPFGDTQEFFKKSTQHSLPNNEINGLLDISDDPFFDGFDDSDQPMNSTTNQLNEPQLEVIEQLAQELNEDINDDMNDEFKDDLKGLTQDMDFLLKNSFIDEEVPQEVAAEVEVMTENEVQNVDNEETKPSEVKPIYKGFRTVTGKATEMSATDRTKAELLFKDIEEWMLKEIIDNKKLKDCDSDDETYSQIFILSSVTSGRQKQFELKYESKCKPTPKAIQTKDTIGEQFEAQLASEWDSMKTSYKFAPLTSRPGDLTAKRALIPMTSTPKTSSAKRKINFEPKDSISFAQQLNDL